VVGIGLKHLQRGGGELMEHGGRLGTHTHSTHDVIKLCIQISKEIQRIRKKSNKFERKQKNWKENEINVSEAPTSANKETTFGFEQNGTTSKIEQT
jgi:hypothetical protein